MPGSQKNRHEFHEFHHFFIHLNLVNLVKFVATLFASRPKEQHSG
jgi:hypothetical protein